MKDTMKINKLRLVLTLRCNRHCDGCCNNQWDWSKIPVFNGNYSEVESVFFTGGEPLLFPDMVREEVLKAKQQNPDIRTYLYTAKTDEPAVICELLEIMDGLTVTLHEPADVPRFRELDAYLNDALSDISDKSLRCNVFKEAGWIVPTAHWKFKTDMEWIPDCPLPVGETLMRHENVHLK